MAALRSSNFEDGTIQGWTASGGTLSAVTERTAGGSRSLKAVKTSEAGPLFTFQPIVDVTPGEMTVTFAAGQAASTARSGLVFVDLLPGYAYLEPSGGAVLGTADISTSGMTSLIRTFTVPAGYTQAQLVVRLDNCAVNDALYLDEVVTSQGATNSPPTVNAGPDQTADVGQLVTLTATGTDPDGTVASYTWTQTGGMAVALGGSGTAAVRTFTPASGGTYVFSVVATDNAGFTSPVDTVTVTVGEVGTALVVRGTELKVARLRAVRGDAIV